MVDVKEKLVPSRTTRNIRLEKLQQSIFERGVERHAIPAAAVNYRFDDASVAELRFIRQGLPCHSPSRLFEQAGLQAAPLWMFIDQLPKKLDLPTRVTFQKKFGRNPAFVFLGADEFLWILHQTIAGCRIDRFPMPDGAGDVWIVGYTPA